MKNLEVLAKFPSENPNPVLRVTINKILYVNKAGELLLSVKEGDLIPKIIQSGLTEALNHNIFKTLEVKINNLNYIFDIAPITDEGYANIYGRNINDLKTVENSLRESEKKYKSLFENALNGILISNSEGNLISVNLAAAELLGYNSPNELIGSSASNIYLNPDDRAPIVKGMMDSGFIKDFSIKLKKKDGSSVDTLFSAILHKDIKGNLDRIEGIFIDITERKKAEEELKTSEKRFRTIAENFPNGAVVLYDHDLCYLLAEGEVIEKVGLTSEKMVGKNLRALVTDEYYNALAPHYKAALKGETHRFEFEFEGLIHDTSTLPIKDSNGNIIAGMSISRDITERKRVEQNLKESEAKWRAITEYSPDHILMMDKDAKILFINYTVPDLTVDEVLGRDYYDFVQEEFKEQQRKYYKEVMETGTPLQFETGYVDKDGNQFYFDVHSGPVWKEGKVIGIINRSIDITERKKKEEEIRLHSEIMNHMSEGVFLFRIDDGTIVYANPAFEEMFGYNSGEIIGKDVSTVNAPTDKTPEEIKEKITNLLLQNGGWHSEIKNIKKDGTLFWCYVNISLFNHPKYGQVLVSINTDITERKKIEVEIVKLAKFPSENPFPVLRATKEKILYSNMAGEDLFKIKEGSRPPYKLLDWINQAINLDTPQLIEVDFANKTFSFNILAIKDEEYVNIYGRDITERKRAEIDLKKSEATYREAYNRAEFYKDIFTHDINNILQNISNGIQLNEMYLNKPDKSKAVKRNIDIIKRQVKRGANLVSNVRKLSKISESESSLFIVNSNEVLTKTINYVKNSFHDKNLKINIQFIEDNFKILANELLEDVFENILTNSINYNDNELVTINVKVSKELRREINYIKFQISDNGIGITDERKQKIFIRGYSEEMSVHGMGLGLSLVKKIIESYNGEIWMEDRVKGDYTKGSSCIILIQEAVNNG